MNITSTQTHDAGNDERDSMYVIIYPHTVGSSIKAGGGSPVRERESAGNNSSSGRQLFLQLLTERSHLR